MRQKIHWFLYHTNIIPFSHLDILSDFFINCIGNFASLFDTCDVSNWIFRYFLNLLKGYFKEICIVYSNYVRVFLI